MKTYIVTITPKFPCWCNKEETINFLAKDRNDAIKRARKIMSNSDYSYRDFGPLLYSAKVAN